MIVAKTPRLLLKQFSEEDVNGFFLLNNDPEVLKYTGDQPFHSKHEVLRFITEYDQYEKYGFGRWSVYTKTYEYLGFSGLKYSPSTGEIDIGFRFMRKYWGLGYATESARAGLEIAFLKHQAKKVIARAVKENFSSHAVIKKLGMNATSSFMEDGYEWIKYELLHQDWLTTTKASPEIF